MFDSNKRKITCLINSTPLTLCAFAQLAAIENFPSRLHPVHHVRTDQVLESPHGGSALKGAGGRQGTSHVRQVESTGDKGTVETAA